MQSAAAKDQRARGQGAGQASRRDGRAPLHVVAGQSLPPAEVIAFGCHRDGSASRPLPALTGFSDFVEAGEGIEAGQVAEAVLATLELHAPRPHPSVSGQYICGHDLTAWPCKTTLVIAKALTGPEREAAQGAWLPQASGGGQPE